MNRIPLVQYLRAVAAGAVYGSHVPQCYALVFDPENAARSVWLWGGKGADLFFVISGFIIAHAHWNDLGRPDRVAPYLARRPVRIYPLHLMVMAVLLPWAMYKLPMWREPWTVAAQLLLLLPGHPNLTFVTWSLSMELLFYGAFALAIVNRGLGLAAGGALLLYMPWYYWAEFAVGVALCRVLKLRPAAPRLPWLSALGDASYALYLIHVPALIYGFKVLDLLGTPGLAPVVVAAIPLLSVALYRQVEKPVLGALSGLLPFHGDAGRAAAETGALAAGRRRR
jgi:peptidoglycan/LPS O-acetylase OafA/YrhL